jgi:predicted DNA-binding transcriptional regulator YafY
VRADPERLDHLRTAVGSHAVAAAERIAAADSDGWIRLRLRLDWPDEVPARLLAAGASIEVLDPPEIRDRLARIARHVADRYEAAPAGL